MPRCMAYSVIRHYWIIAFWYPVPTIMDYERATAHRKGMDVRDGQIPHICRTWHTAHAHDRRHAAIRLPHRFAHVEEARDEPAVVSREPGMVGGRMDDFGVG